MLWLFRPSHSSSEITPPPTVVPVPGTNDENNFTPRPRKRKTSPLISDVPKSVKVIKHVQEQSQDVITPAIQKIRFSLKQIEHEKQDERITQKAQEIGQFLESPTILAAISSISNLEAKKLQEQLNGYVEQLILELRAKRAQQEFEQHQATLAHKEEQLQKLQARLQLIERAKQIRAERIAREQEEEEMALLYLMMDS